MSHIIRYSSEQANKRRESKQSIKIERDALVDLTQKNHVTLNQPTADSIVASKTFYRQTAEIHNYHLTDPIILG